MSKNNRNKKKKKKNKNKKYLTPLVSVIVVNYNHLDTIIDTLNSIKEQTYENIELIIADDCSSDNSIKVVRKWLKKNRDRFVNSQILVADKNTGVSANCNRGVKASKGEYIKIIASDDILRKFYVEGMLNGIGDNDLAFCYVCMFTTEDELKLPPEELDIAPNSASKVTYSLSPRQLYKKQLMRNDFNAPAAFIKRTVFDEVGFFDEKYPMMEDLPFWLKCVKSRKKITFVEIYGVLYRRSPKSISLGVSPYADGNQSETQKRFKSDFNRFMRVRFRHMIMNFMFAEIYYSFGEKVYEKLSTKFKNKKHISKFITKFLVIIAPFALASRRINKKTKIIDNQKKQEEQKFKQKNDLLDLKRQYKLDLHNQKRMQMFKKRAFPITKDDKKRLKNLKQKYRDDRKKILKKEPGKRKVNKGKSNRVLLTKRVLLGWDRQVWKWGEVVKQKNGSKLYLYAILLLSPIALYRKLHKTRTLSARKSGRVKELNRLFKDKLKTEPIFENDPLSKIGWETIYQKEINYQKDYRKNHKQGDQLNILFIVHLGFCFSSYESIILAMKNNPKFNPIVLVVPKTQPGMTVHYEYDVDLIKYISSKDFKYYLGYENSEWKSLFEFDPDGVFYQTPYEYQIPIIYSSKYRFAFPKIMYTPYGPWVMDKSVTKYIESGIQKDFFTSSWKVFMDKFSLEMLEYASPKFMDKCILSGSPKVDFYNADFIENTYCWKNHNSHGRKKVIWMPRWGLAEDRSSFPDYYEYFIDLVQEGNIEFVMRPHPLLWGDLLRTKFFTKKEHEVMINNFSMPYNSNIDYDYDYREGLLSCDFLIMDFSSIVYEYLPTGKPLIYTKKDNTLLDARIIEICYVVENRTELTKTIKMLLAGIDPLKSRRLEAIKDYNYFPHNSTTNGTFIMNYIEENIN